MKIKTMFQWSWKVNWIALVVMTGVLIGVQLAVSVILLAALPQAELAAGVQMTSSSPSVLVMSFIMGCITYAYGLRFGGSHGVSRRSVYWGFILFSMTFSAALIFATYLIELATAWSGVPDVAIFRLVYAGWLDTAPAFPGFVARFFWETAVVLFASMLGYFMGGAFYRLGKVGKVLLAAGTPVVLFVLLPVAVSLLPQNILASVADFFNRLYAVLYASPYPMIAVFLAAGALFAFFSWLTMRRAPVNPAATL